jgi:superfamily I DNA/RNA helicase
MLDSIRAIWRSSKRAARVSPEARTPAKAQSGHAAPRTSQPEPLYGPQKMPVSAEQVAAMRAEVGAAVAQGIVAQPTEAQWAMILSSHPATCVVAGAGSGKSTTLVLRVVFMWCHLGIPPEDMTVISFTRASCEELRHSLQRVLSFEPWRQRLAPEDAAHLEERCRTLVSTFHAALGRVSRRVWGRAEWFDLIEPNATPRDDRADDLDNPVLGGPLTKGQRDLLNTAYRSLFNEDRVFRQHIIALLRHECDRHTLLRLNSVEVKHLQLASERDLELAQRIQARWGKDWVLPGVDPTPFVAFRANNLPFYANGRIIKTGMPIFLSLGGMKDGKPLFSKDDRIGQGKRTFPVVGALTIRRQIIERYCDREVLHLDHTEKLEWLRYRLEHLADEDFRNVSAPAFGVQLRGELAPVDVVEAFYAQANFMESLGLDVAQACQRAQGQLASGSSEWHFCAALTRFWPSFEAQLRSLAVPMRRFNRAFLDLGEQAPTQPAVPADALRPFTHLLIDEFQDISPQIVSWLRAMQRRVRALGAAPSLMAIGDDWQSIYGWRGSAPDLFIDFARHFPVHPQLGGPLQCRLMDNFRSVEPILRDAERIVAAVGVKVDKQAQPRRRADPALDHGVRLIKGVQVRSDPKAVVAAIHEQLAFVRSLERSDKNKILVLSRSNQTLNTVQQALRKAGGANPGEVRFETFHRAKGLQGEVAILCENCVYEESHPLRNAIYAASGLFRQSYDEAARDEALRLAYVAVTRGIRRVLWFVDQPKGASALLPSSP